MKIWQLVVVALILGCLVWLSSVIYIGICHEVKFATQDQLM
jgi:hypothetical protein